MRQPDFHTWRRWTSTPLIHPSKGRPFAAVRTSRTALPHLDAAVEDTLVRPTQRELFHRTTPVLLGFLRFLVSVNFFRRQFHHKFVMFFQPDTDPCLTTDAIDTSLFSHEAALFHSCD